MRVVTSFPELVAETSLRNCVFRGHKRAVLHELKPNAGRGPTKDTRKKLRAERAILHEFKLRAVLFLQFLPQTSGNG